MAWIYLALALVGAALMLIVWWPPRGRAQAIGFVVGWLYGELPLHHVALQALITLGFAATGAFEAAPGRVGLLIAVASWVGLLAHWATSFRAGAAAEAALVRSFGADYAERVAPELRARFRDGLDWGRILWPFSPRRNRAVRRVVDVPFARVGGLELRLDVYAPLEPGNARPVLLQIHGGGWTVGTKNEQALPLMYHLAERGWVCVSAAYRLSPRATFPDHLIDCKRALAWVREHIAEYGGDPGFVVVTGGSAGGHLCALLALTPDDPQYQPGFESADTRVQGCIAFYGVYDWTGRTPRPQHGTMARLLERRVMKTSLEADPEGYRRASPVWRIREDAPPFLIVHGDSDSLVAVEDARDFAELLEKESRSPVGYLEVRHAQHAFEIFDGVRTQHVVNAAERFGALVYSDYLARSRTPR